MNTNLSIVSTSEIDHAVELLKDCVSTNAIGVITGVNGTGKTEALKSLAKKYPKLGFTGTAFYYRCCLVKSHARGLKDIVEALGRKLFSGSNSGGSIQFAVRTCLHELQRKDIHSILLDEADAWSKEAIESVIALRDYAIESGWSLTLIFAGASNPNLWIGQVPAAQSRTLKIETFLELNVETMLGVLRSWNQSFESLALSIESGNKEAEKVARKIHTHTKGNLRRLSYFASLHLTHCPNEEPSLETLEKVLPKLAAI